MQRLVEIFTAAKKYDVEITIDAEESDRLEISLDILHSLCKKEELKDFNKISFVVQAYQKRALSVLDSIIEIARDTNKKISIRLVKGAYIDYEIKKSHVENLDFPVFTHKSETDFNYVLCADKILQNSSFLKPQFATHNIVTVASILSLIKKYNTKDYEFQSLYGMGQMIYKKLVKEGIVKKCRIYAPVGDLNSSIAYLTRRILENGSTDSFLNNLIKDKTNAEELFLQIPLQENIKKPTIINPSSLMMDRVNSKGFDVSSVFELDELRQKYKQFAQQKYIARSVINGNYFNSKEADVVSPCDLSDVVGKIHLLSKDQLNEIDLAFEVARKAFEEGKNESFESISKKLLKAADIMEEKMPLLLNLLAREAGKILLNAINEVREGVDFLRYYAKVGNLFNDDTNKPLGVVCCISPWNFPVAIFIGQIASALMCKNSVIAKPAENTSICGFIMCEIMYEAGFSKKQLQLIIAKGSDVGDYLTSHKYLSGVMFTGSTFTAKKIQVNLSKNIEEKIIPFIAETGGLNVMIADTTQSTSSIVKDATVSAFDSAGQRCSALRILCVKKEQYDDVVSGIKNTIDNLKIGKADDFSTQVSSIIHQKALDDINNYIKEQKQNGLKVYQNEDISFKKDGFFVSPTLIEVENIYKIDKEIFGPVLHIVKYSDYNDVLNYIDFIKYGLTMGIETKIKRKSKQIINKARVGNIYVNRNTIGAVVESQPFGGDGLSGTGPKAGGPLYLYKMLSSHDCELVLDNECKLKNEAIKDLILNDNIYKVLSEKFIKTEKFAKKIFGIHFAMPSPSGEFNEYKVLPKGNILCIGSNRLDLMLQVFCATAVGNNVIAVRNLESEFCAQKLAEVGFDLHLVKDKLEDVVKKYDIKAVLFKEGEYDLKTVLSAVCAKEDIIGVYKCMENEIYPLEKIVYEKTVSTNIFGEGSAVEG